MKLMIDISKEKYDEIMSMDWKNCRRIFDEELRAIHDGKVLEQEPCEDCVSRQAVLDVVEREQFKGDAISEIEKLPPVTQQPNKWIPVNQPPKASGRYLVTTRFLKHSQIEIADYATDLHKVDEYDFPKHEAGWYNYDSEYGHYAIDNVIAWMSLPKPYKQARQGRKRGLKYERNI